MCANCVLSCACACQSHSTKYLHSLSVEALREFQRASVTVWWCCVEMVGSNKFGQGVLIMDHIYHSFQARPLATIKMMRKEQEAISLERVNFEILFHVGGSAELCEWRIHESCWIFSSFQSGMFLEKATLSFLQLRERSVCTQWYVKVLQFIFVFT